MEPLSPNMAGLDLQSGRGVDPSSIQNGQDDTAVFGDDPVSEEPLFQTNTNGQPKEELYSTPLSWARPNPGARTYTRLSPEEEAQLRSIAMPQIAKSQGRSQNYPSSPSSASSPEANNNRRKRKSSVDDDEDEDEEDRADCGRHHPKKTAHNMIEKRYRTNLNDKITALRDSVPSLRIISRKNSRGEEAEEDLQGLTPAHKLNKVCLTPQPYTISSNIKLTNVLKATVLSKATEYIAHLEKRNKSLVKENAALKSRVEAFEILMLARQSPTTNQSSGNGNARPRQSNQRFSNDAMMR